MSRKKKKNKGTLDQQVSSSSSPSKVRPLGSKSLTPQSPLRDVNPKLQSYDPVYENLKRSDPNLDFNTYQKILGDRALEDDLKKRYITKGGVKYYTHPFLVAMYSDRLKHDLTTLNMLKNYATLLPDHHTTMLTVYQILATLLENLTQSAMISDSELDMHGQASDILSGILSDLLARIRKAKEG